MSIYGPYPEYGTGRTRFIDIQKVDTEPVTEPVTLADMKAFLRVDFTDDDAVITDLITSCRQAIEESCCISIVGKTITVIAEWSGERELPYGPVKEITSIERKSENAYGALVLNEGYYVDGTGYLSLKLQNCGRSKMVYKAGYATVPKDLILDLKRLVAYCYEHRGDEALTSLQGGMERPKSMDEAIELFASKHRRLWL